MFLNQLSYQEKRMFLDLSIHIAKANDVLDAAEKALISQYCNEMELPPIELYETEPLETVIDYFALADLKIRKIVILESLGLAYVDGTYDEKEESLVKKVAEEIGISLEVFEQLHIAIKDYYCMCSKLAAIIAE